MLSRAARQGFCRAASCAWAQAGLVATRSSSSSSCVSCVAPSMSSALKDQHGLFMSTMTYFSLRHVSSSKMPAVRLEILRRASSSSSRHAVRLHRSRADRCSLPESCVRPRGFRSSTAGLPSAPPVFSRAETAYRCNNERRDCLQQGGAPASFARAFGGQSVVPWELALFLVDEVGFMLPQLRLRRTSVIYIRTRSDTPHVLLCFLKI